MRVLMAQFQIKEAALQEFTAARNRILSALSELRPHGVRYTWCALPDGITFIGWLELDEGIQNPLPTLAAGQDFLRSLSGWIAAPPTREELTVVGSYPSTAL